MNNDLTSAEKRQAWWILALNTFAFTICFAAWMMNGVLITYLGRQRRSLVEPVADGVADRHSGAYGSRLSAAAGNCDGQVGRPHRLRPVATLFRSTDVLSQLLQYLLAILCRRVGIRLLWN